MRKLFITTVVPHCQGGKLREQVFSTFSSPCFEVKAVYNYEHRGRFGEEALLAYGKT
jgi:hypothetical protein